MLRITGKIKDFRYNKLILYSLLRCDQFTFEISDYHSEEFSSERSKEFFEYKERIEYFFKYFKPYIEKKYIDKEHGYSEVYVMSLNIDSIAPLLATYGLYSWKYPDMPEDLRFFSKGECWLKSVAHENLCWIYTDCDVEKEIIRKVIGLKYYEVAKELDSMEKRTLDDYFNW